jgi:hypothetical protein
MILIANLCRRGKGNALKDCTAAAQRDPLGLTTGNGGSRRFLCNGRGFGQHERGQAT